VTEIRLAGREILDHPRDMARPYGLFIGPDGFQGWDGLPAGRREALARAVQHGEHDVPVFLPSRVITIDGWIIAPDEAELGQATMRLTGIGATGERMKVTVEHQGLTLWAWCRRILAQADDTGVRVGKHLRSRFQLQLLCADPRKYGEVATLPGDRLDPANPTATATSVDVFHYGNFPASPVIVIPTAPAAYSITAGGKTFSVAGATAGGTHEVHLRNGRVYRNGTEMARVGKGDLWSVPADASLTHVLSVPGRVKIPDTSV
jgi:hypothetical protein